MRFATTPKNPFDGSKMGLDAIVRATSHCRLSLSAGVFLSRAAPFFAYFPRRNYFNPLADRSPVVRCAPCKLANGAVIYHRCDGTGGTRLPKICCNLLARDFRHLVRP